MRQIAIFNNKGGAGKSTITVFLADFFSSLHFRSSRRPVRILVVDADPQGSAAKALVGEEAVQDRVRSKRTLGPLLQRLLGAEEVDLSSYLLRRPEVETDTRKVKLAPVDVLASDQDTSDALEEQGGQLVLSAAARKLPRLLEDHYDFVFVDLPANVKRRDHLPMSLLAGSEYVIVPTEPSYIAVSALPRTFEIVQDAAARASQNKGMRGPSPIAVLLNKTNKSFASYKNHIEEIRSAAGAAGTSVLQNVIPPASRFMSATDSTLDFATLRDKFDTYYDHVRLVTRELLRRIEDAEGKGTS